MSEQATKRVCLVIGVGDGVGAAIAKAFALDGFETVITRRARNLPDLEAIAQKIREQGGVVHARGVDARSEEETI
ncbi:MAG: short-chain dehydrogenase, partial [Alphaproteobacteria bacterium PA3]